MKLFTKATDDIRIDDGSAIGATVVHTTGGVIVGAARLHEGGVIGDHGIDTAGGDTPEEARLTQATDIEVSLWVGLGYDADVETGIMKHFADDRSTDERTVDVGITRNQDDIQAIPAECRDFLECCREKHERIIIAIL